MRTETINRVGFNKQLEVDFLATLDNFDIRKQVLENEVATAVHEAFLNKFENGYFLKDKKIVDKTTFKPLEELTNSCGRMPEIEAMVTIQEELLKGTELVVNFSPKNVEYDYPMDCVDFWWKNNEEVRWLRVVVNNDFESLKTVYESIGGEEKETVMEMLAAPVSVNDLKIGEIIAMLDTMESINKVTDIEIRESVRTIMEGFVDKFNDEIVKDPDVIFRLFSTAMMEAKKINEMKELGIRHFVSKEEMDDYLNAKMQIAIMRTGGCSSMNEVGYIVSKPGGGFDIVSGKAPEGYKICDHCGLGYSGDVCPLCVGK